jgi:hypothetical protein
MRSGWVGWSDIEYEVQNEPLSHFSRQTQIRLEIPGATCLGIPSHVARPRQPDFPAGTAEEGATISRQRHLFLKCENLTTPPPSLPPHNQSGLQLYRQGFQRFCVPPLAWGWIALASLSPPQPFPHTLFSSRVRKPAFNSLSKSCANIWKSPTKVLH